MLFSKCEVSFWPNWSIKNISTYVDVNTHLYTTYVDLLIGYRSCQFFRFVTEELIFPVQTDAVLVLFYFSIWSWHYETFE